MSLTCIHVPVANGRQYNSGTTDIPLVGSVDDTNISKWRAQFDAILEQKLHFLVPIFSDFSSNIVIRLRWRGNATTGAVVWKAYYGFINSTSAPQQTSSTATTTTTIAGTANLLNETAITLTGGTANYLMPFTISRDATNVADTCTVATDLLDVQVEYTCNTATAKEYFFVPAKAMNIGSTAVLSQVGLLTSNDNVVDAFQITTGSMLDFKFNIPSNFASALKWSFIMQHLGSFNTTVARLNMGVASVGASGNPSLTTGTNQSVSSIGGASYTQWSTAATCDVQPTVGQEVYCRCEVTTTPSSTGYLVGCLFEYAASTRNPGTIRLDPNSGNYGSTGGMTLTANSDSNSTKLVARAANAVDSKVDFCALIPSIWASGGTIRVRWRSTASSGNGYFDVYSARVTSSGSTDPSLTPGTATAFATAGANLINEFTYDVSTSLNANDELWIRLYRLGSNTGIDTLGATVDIVEVVFEANIT